MIARLGSVTNRISLMPLALLVTGIGLIGVSLSADLLGFSEPGLSPSQVSLAISGFALFLSGVVISSNTSTDRTYAGPAWAEWLLLLAGVVAAAFAAELVVVGGLPAARWKQLTFLSVVLGSALLGLGHSKIGVYSLKSAIEGAWMTILRTGSVILQLGLLLLLVRHYQVESQAFYSNVLALTFYGFLIHIFLPLQYRLPFFLLLSLAAFFGVLGLTNGLWLVGTGFALIALTWLPIRFAYRLLLVTILGLVLILARGGVIAGPWPGAIWPILGSIFMFRFIIYLYDQQHTKKRITVWESLSYFFLLPNVVFPFFPIVDFATFRRTYFNEERTAIYQRGVQWMIRGIMQLLAYRFVNYYLVISVEEVTDAWDLALFAITNFALYLRVTGQFHLIIGLLHLFGFNLPETNHRYFLASSFTDLWRRANIYWKDFMQKVFYYPAYFRLSKFRYAQGPVVALVLATIFVFIATWFLHAYQWFWLRGAFLFTATDILFWTILALLVIINTLNESRGNRKRRLAGGSFSPRDLVALSLRTAATFSLLVIFWSLWTSPTIREWIALWAKAATPSGLAILGLVFLGIAFVAGFFIWITGEGRPALSRRTDSAASLSEGARDFFGRGAINAAGIMFLLLLATPAVYNRLGPRVASFAADMSTARLSDRDAQLMLRGYYEDLIGVDRFNPELWELYSKRPSDWPVIQDTELARLTGDFMGLELVPEKQIMFHGALFTTNSWGMRDQEYSLTPAPGTHRIVLLGPSFVMGSGVADHEVFESVLEQQLNNSGGGNSYEILNMGVAGFSALQEVYLLETQALQYQPDTVFYVAHQLEEEILPRNLATFITQGVDIPYPALRQIAADAGVTSDMGQLDAESLLRPYRRQMLTWLYQRMAQIAGDHDINVVWIFMPALETTYEPEYADSLVHLAGEAGFNVLNLADVYDGHDESSIIVAEWDKHPNALGHRLIAERLYREIAEHADRNPRLLD